MPHADAVPSSETMQQAWRSKSEFTSNWRFGVVGLPWRAEHCIGEDEGRFLYSGVEEGRVGQGRVG